MRLENIWQRILHHTVTSPLQLIPQVFYGLSIGFLLGQRTEQNLNSVLSEPFLCGFGDVLWLIVLLDDADYGSV